MILRAFLQTDQSVPHAVEPFQLLTLEGGLYAVYSTEDSTYQVKLVRPDMLSHLQAYGTILPMRTPRSMVDEEAMRQFHRHHEATILWFLEDLRHHAEWVLALGVVDSANNAAEVAEGVAVLWERCVSQAADVCPLPLRVEECDRIARRGAFLVPEPLAQEWQRNLHLMQHQAAEAGLTITVEGPLPPWHFAPEL